MTEIHLSAYYFMSADMCMNRRHVREDRQWLSDHAFDGITWDELKTLHETDYYPLAIEQFGRPVSGKAQIVRSRFRLQNIPSKTFKDIASATHEEHGQVPFIVNNPGLGGHGRIPGHRVMPGIGAELPHCHCLFSQRRAR